MSRALSPATGRAYGLARVARVWRLPRATVYRHRAAPDPAAPAGPARRGPVGACSDAALLEQIRAQILGSRLHGEGYRKIWARLRHAGIRTLGPPGPAADGPPWPARAAPGRPPGAARP